MKKIIIKTFFISIVPIIALASFFLFLSGCIPGDSTSPYGTTYNSTGNEPVKATKVLSPNSFLVGTGSIHRHFSIHSGTQGYSPGCGATLVIFPDDNLLLNQGVVSANRSYVLTAGHCVVDTRASNFVIDLLDLKTNINLNNVLRGDLVISDRAHSASYHNVSDFSIKLFGQKGVYNQKFSSTGGQMIIKYASLYPLDLALIELPVSYQSLYADYGLLPRVIFKEDSNAQISSERIMSNNLGGEVVSFNKVTRITVSNSVDSVVVRFPNFDIDSSRMTEIEIKAYNKIKFVVYPNPLDKYILGNYDSLSGISGSGILHPDNLYIMGVAFSAAEKGGVYLHATPTFEFTKCYNSQTQNFDLYLPTCKLSKAGL